jgi:SAM-dependent methyltransferase
MTGIHKTAAGGFVRPDTYDLGRPGYPQGAVDALGLTGGMRVADLGCGTGKLTGMLVPTGAAVVGIEPLPPMLESFRKNLPDIEVCSGTAEAMPVADGSFDVIVCASAFHWFNHATAIPEIHRALADGGRLAIIWNRRDELGGWAHEFWRITERYRGDTPGYRTSAWRDALEASPLFGAIAEEWFDHVQVTDVEGLVARVASVSFIELLPRREREAVLAETREFVESHPDLRGRDTIELPYRTVLYTVPRLS